MKHLPALAVLALALAPTAGRAQVQTYYHSGVWDAFSGRSETGGAVCGVGTTDRVTNKRLSIRFDIGGSDTTFTASKPEWSVPENTRVRVVMQVGLNAPWTVPGTGQASGHGITWTLDRDAIQIFDQQFRAAPSMTLSFPDGNEPAWTLSLAGSTVISDTFGRCVRDLTRQSQTGQPLGNVPPPPTGPTQPFSTPAAPPPSR